MSKESIFEAADKSSDGGSDSDEAPEIDGNLSRPVVADDRSLTYEELRQHLHRQIKELRSNRNTRKKKKKEKNEKKKSKKNKKNKDKKAGEEAEPSSQGKRKREESEEEKGKNKKAKSEKRRDAAFANLTFSHIKIGGEDDKKKKKKKLSKQQALEKAKKDPGKGEKISKRQSG